MERQGNGREGSDVRGVLHVKYVPALDRKVFEICDSKGVVIIIRLIIKKYLYFKCFLKNNTYVSTF